MLVSSLPLSLTIIPGRYRQRHGAVERTAHGGDNAEGSKRVETARPNAGVFSKDWLWPRHRIRKPKQSFNGCSLHHGSACEGVSDAIDDFDWRWQAGAFLDLAAQAADDGVEMAVAEI